MSTSYDSYENPYVVDVVWTDGVKKTFHNVGWVSDGGATHLLTLRMYMCPNLVFVHIVSVPLFNVRHFTVSKVTMKPTHDDTLIYRQGDGA